METLCFNFPFSKVDKSRRLITGVATADNIDPAGDLVTFEASMEAFEKWIGNIREMHGKNAVGKSVGFRPVTVMHEGIAYRGIEVDAYVSKGAEDTWQKVLDGTLRGFSIAGPVLEKTTEYSELSKRKYNKISKYSLGELSLVDNPGNPAAIFSMIKVADGGGFEDVLNKDQKQIFYCEKDGIAKADNNICYNCDSPMVEIGYSEEFSMEILQKMIQDYELRKGGQMTETDTLVKQAVCSECGAPLDGEESEDDEKMCKACSSPDEKTEKVADLQNKENNDIVNDMSLTKDADKAGLIRTLMKGVFDFVGASPEATAEVEVAVEEIAKSEVAEEIETEIVEKDNGGSDMNTEELLGQITELFGNLSKSVDEKIDEIQKSVDAVNAKVDEAAASVTEVTEKVATIDEATAIKKSVDTIDEDNKEVVVEKTTFWDGIFVPAPIREVLGYDS